MKKIILIGALAVIVTGMNAQDLKEADVPQAVKAAFAKNYPGVKVEEWEKEGVNFEAGYKMNKKEHSVMIDASGNILETEVEIEISELPAGVREYIAANHKGAKIKEAARISSADGVVTYEADIGSEDLIFDAAGQFVRSEKDADEDDKD